MVNVPIIGSVAAGEPIFAEQNVEGYMPVLPGECQKVKRLFSVSKEKA